MIVSLATATYGAGRLAFIPGRLNTINTGGESTGPLFRRRLFEWLSGSSSDDNIEVAVLDISEGVDSVDRGIFQAPMLSVDRISPDSLTEPALLSRYGCLVIEGAGNHNISPLSRSSIISFASSGKGVLYLGFSTEKTVTAVPSGYTIGVSSINFEVVGRTKWTDAGLSSDIYSESVSDVSIPLVNLVYGHLISTNWSVLAYHDDSPYSSPGNKDGVDDLVYMQSSAYSFPGEYFIARFASVYEKGVIDVEK